MKTCQLCGSKFPNTIKIDGKRKNLCKRKYCLSCSPFNKHNTRQLININGDKQCPKCSINKPRTCFYARRNSEGTGSYCKPCTKIQTLERIQKFKRECVAYKGGKCHCCGYNRCDSALEFHHKDPTKKDFNISHVRSNALTDVILAELDKCLLLCSNCHRELHAGYLKVTGEGIEPTDFLPKV